MQEKIVELYNSIMQECGMEVEKDSAHKGTYAAIRNIFENLQRVVRILLFGAMAIILKC